MAQNKTTPDVSIVSAMHRVDENLSETESSDSDNKIGANQESVCKCGVSYWTSNV
jgi:hypothetical protein